MTKITSETTLAPARPAPPAMLELFALMGLTPNYKAYRYVRDAVLSVDLDDPAYELRVGRLYREIAQRYGVSPFSVEHDIRTAADRCWQVGDPELLRRIHPSPQPPGNAAFLTALAVYLYRFSS